MNVATAPHLSGLTPLLPGGVEGGKARMSGLESHVLYVNGTPCPRGLGSRCGTHSRTEPNGTMDHATSFADALTTAGTLPPSLPEGGGQEDNPTARKAAQQFVADGLILPLLKQMRNNPLDAKLFDKGPGQGAFYQRLDMIFADRIVESSRFPLVDRIYDQIMQRTKTSASANPRQSQSVIHRAVTPATQWDRKTGVNIHA